MVFQTAPPQPASNARITCSPQLVGGAEASQNGLGERMPAKLTDKSGISVLERLCDRDSGPFSVRHSVHHFTAAIDTIAAGEILWAACPVQQPRVRGLSDGRDHHVARQLKLSVLANALQ